MNRISIDGGKTFYDIKTQRHCVRELCRIAAEQARPDLWTMDYLNKPQKDLLIEIIIQMGIESPDYFEKLINGDISRSLFDYIINFFEYTGKDLIIDFPNAIAVQRSIARSQGTFIDMLILRRYISPKGNWFSDVVELFHSHIGRSKIQ